jgi:primosomal protein N' (replication factor Y) (superfamily II helicase)
MNHFLADPSAPERIARVEPLTRTRAVRGPFDYRLGPDHDDVGTGSLLRVPFGGSRMLGIVIGIADRSELALDRLSEPDAVLASRVPDDLVSLALWMAAEYCSTPARALSLVLSPGAAKGTKAHRVLVAELTEDGRHALGNGAQLNAAQRAALERLDHDGPTTAAALGTERLRRLEARGLVAIAPRVRRRVPARWRVGAVHAEPPPLTASQRQALEPMLAAIQARDHERLLLHGVTGSGKTEVYLRAVERTLALDRTAIVLVPEIALTPQALQRFQMRFGDRVAVLHSALSDGERHDEWMRLASGEARVCVGPRSAVFAPLEEIGLIVVDEEHEGAYKHEGDPRYDARTVAARRAEQHGAVLVLGSATPRPETVHGMSRLRLPERIDRHPLPPVELLDMREQHHPLHPETRMALADLRRDGGKGIILVNRRGWSNFLTCRTCGRVWMCPNCEVALVLHRGSAAGFVACHHCGHREPVPDRCGACGSSSVARHGAGTERVEHELREAISDREFPVLRLDAGAAGLHGRASVLERFESAPAGLLVGTQIVAKGHDFPDVTLGIVLDADQTLRFPDFRAEERTFSLITQLAGRAGRGERGGRVLVQTLSPDARALRLAAHHDTDEFLSGELERREALRYPPFSSLIRIVCSATTAADAQAAAEALRERIGPADASVLGPAPLFALRGRARSQLVIKAGDRAGAIAAVGAAVDRVAVSAARRGVSLSVDVDPQ